MPCSPIMCSASRWLCREAGLPPHRPRRHARWAAMPTGNLRAHAGPADSAPSTPGRFALYGNDPIPRCLSPGLHPAGGARSAQGQPARATSRRPTASCSSIFLYAPERGASRASPNIAPMRWPACVDTPAVAGRFRGRAGLGRSRDAAAPLVRDRGREASVERSFANGDYAMRVRNAAPADQLQRDRRDPGAGADVALGVGGRLDPGAAAAASAARAGSSASVAAYQPGDRGLDLPDAAHPGAGNRRAWPGLRSGHPDRRQARGRSGGRGGAADAAGPRGPPSGEEQPPGRRLSAESSFARRRHRGGRRRLCLDPAPGRRACRSPPQPSCRASRRIAASR